MTAAVRSGSGYAPLVATRALFFLCDVQERFRDVILGMDGLVATSQLLLGTANALSIPTVVTEQYPKAMLHTMAELQPLIEGAPVFEKTKFSMVVPEVEALLAGPAYVERTSAVLFGIEAHICIQQTCLELLGRGFSVHVVQDATSSQRCTDRSVALRRMQAAGAHITTAESIVFELIGDSRHPKFRQVSALVKARVQNGGIGPDDAVATGY